jgi:hypothetical protein
MRATLSRRHGANLSIKVFLKQCVGNALTAVYLRADAGRQGLLLETGATAAHASVFMSSQRG